MRDKFIREPFALTGDKSTVPDGAQGDGKVSFNQGWTPDYSKDLSTDPSAKPIDRAQMNYLFLVITQILRHWQTETFPEWIAPADNGGVAYSYEFGAVVKYRPNDQTPFVTVISAQDNNTAVPTSSAAWLNFSQTVTNAVQRTGGNIPGHFYFAGGAEAPLLDVSDTSSSLPNTQWVRRFANALVGNYVAKGGDRMTGLLDLAAGAIVRSISPDDRSLQVPNTDWVKTVFSAALLSYLPKSGGSLDRVQLFNGATVRSPNINDRSEEIPNTYWTDLLIRNYLAGYINRAGDSMNGPLTLNAGGITPFFSQDDISGRLVSSEWVKYQSAFASGSSIGLVKMPAWLGGALIQWGQLGYPDLSGTTLYRVAFPAAFSPSGGAPIVTVTADAGQAVIPGVVDRDYNGFTLRLTETDNVQVGGVAMWIAIGK